MNRAKFFAAVRKSLFGGSLTQPQVNTLNAILDEVEKQSLPANQIAYILATVLHEVGSDLQPKAENLNYTSAANIKKTWSKRFPTLESAKPYVRQPKKLANFVYGGRMGNNTATDGWTYRGEGLVQITGKDMYAKFSKILNIDLVKNPEMARDLKVAVAILVIGMVQGTFRPGHKLSRYMTSEKSEYVGARNIINADAEKNGASIAAKAKLFEQAIESSEVKPFVVTKKIVEQVQTDLRRLNYPEVGIVDGKPGTMTDGAILLYRHDKGLPVSTKIDALLVETLAADQEPRKFAEARVEATPAVVAENAPVVKENLWGKFLAKGITFVSSIPVAIYGIAQEFTSTKTLLEPVKDTIQNTPWWVWPLLIAVVSGVSWYTHKRATNIGTELYHEGRLR